MKADAQTEMAVKSVLEGFAENYKRRNMDGLLAIMAPDPDVVLYGTGADEKRVGLAQVRMQVERDWSQSEAAWVDFQWMSVSASGPVAWAAADINFNLEGGGERMSFPARTTFVLEKRGNKWLIIQSHFSFPAGEQQAGESFPT
jgi:ketosteroid isomerase-like protein